MRLIVLLFLCFFIQNIFAQNSPQQICGHQLYQPQTTEFDFHPCGAPSFKSQWMKEYQRNPMANQYHHNRSTTYLPVTLHLVGQDDSTGYSSLISIMNAFCKVNQDYTNTGVQFFIEFPIRYIPNTAFNNHDSVHIGGAFMLQYNVPNTSNVYFMNNAAGNCGYNLPYAGMTVSYSCLSGNTFSHELGHSLSIMHPFLGWEGGQSYNSSPQTSFPTAAPTEVYYDYTYYKDTMWLDTLIIDTTEVEYVTRTGANANCQTAADGFCDTPADYLAFRWSCDNNSQSNQVQLDPDTVSFRSEGANIMSYSTCLTDFTSEQAAAMNAFIQSKRQSHLYNQNPVIDTIDGNNLTIVEPMNGSVINQTSNVTFRWNSVPGATHYVLNICASPCSAANLQIEEVLVTDTFYVSNMTYNPRLSFLPYRWKIKAINQSYTCAALSPAYTFNTQFPTNTATIAAVNSFNIYPNPLPSQQPVRLEVAITEASEAQVKLVSITGQVMSTRLWSMEQGYNALDWDTSRLPAGVYTVVLQIGSEKLIKKLIISK